MSVITPAPRGTEVRHVEPGRAAAGLVEDLWVVRSDGPLPPRAVLPDGRPGAVLNLGAPDVWVDPLTRVAEPVGSVLHGPRTVPLVVRRPSPWVVVARLTPWALGALHPADLLVDGRVGLGEGLGVDEDALAGRARRCWGEPSGAASPQPEDAAQAAARVLEDALVAAVRRPTPAERRADLGGIERLVEDERGLLRAVDLARAVDRSLACLHQLFAEEVGLTPAAYLSAVRLSAAARELGAGPDAPAERVVAALRDYVEAGYPPREVERFTGLSTLELRRALRGMEDALTSV